MSHGGFLEGVEQGHAAEAAAVRRAFGVTLVLHPHGASGPRWGRPSPHLFPKVGGFESQKSRHSGTGAPAFTSNALPRYAKAPVKVSAYRLPPCSCSTPSQARNRCPDCPGACGRWRTRGRRLRDGGPRWPGRARACRWGLGTLRRRALRGDSAEELGPFGLCHGSAPPQPMTAPLGWQVG
jgi:hypothetical protein